MAKLTAEEKDILLHVARDAISCYVETGEILALNPQDYTPTLREPGAAFVTLNMHGVLRGCIGALEAYQTLVEDVREHAISAACEDYRFAPVQLDEVPSLHIEISRLTAPVPLDYDAPPELPGKLRMGVDGVILRDGFRRATYLPQVWEKLPDAEAFLSSLCQKMGAPPNLWRRKILEVFIYQVEEFAEPPQTD